MALEIQRTIKEILTESMESKGLNIERLAQLTDIPERYVKAIIDEKISNLPSVPYVRGYLIRIAEALNLNGNDLWQVYKKNFNLRTSGQEDKMPQNRFALKSFKKRNWIFIVLGIFVIIYLSFKINNLLGVPMLDISNPPIDSFTVNDSSIDLRGRIDPQDKLTINNEEVTSDKNGFFDKQFLLTPGPNGIDFKVKRLLGKEVDKTINVIYKQQ